MTDDLRYCTIIDDFCSYCQHDGHSNACASYPWLLHLCSTCNDDDASASACSGGSTRLEYDVALSCQDYSSSTCPVPQCNRTDDEQCMDILLKIKVGDHVIGIDTGSAPLALDSALCRTDAGGINSSSAEVDIQYASTTVHEHAGNRPFWLQSNSHRADGYGAVGIVPLCSHSAAFDSYGISGLLGVVHTSDQQFAPHAVMNILPENDRVFVYTGKRVCLGGGCLDGLQRPAGTQTTRLAPNRANPTNMLPVLEEQDGRSYILDTGSTDTQALNAEYCIVGINDLEYLEINNCTSDLYYKWKPGAQRKCRWRAS